jgi:hypothetical protein
MDYIIVTGYYIIKDFKTYSLLLNILKIIEPVYLGVYLYKKLVVVIDRLGITYAIILVIKDNVKPNDLILNNFKVVV